MRSVSAVAILAGALLLVPGRAAAETALQSEPLKGGAGGVVCACTQLGTQSNVILDFSLVAGSGSTVCQNRTAFAFGSPASCSSAALSDVRICLVRRDDRKSVSSKQFRCTFSSLDAAGDPIAVVPVNIKSKQ